MQERLERVGLFETGERVGAKLIRPFEVFASVEASGGILMILATVVALVWVNSPLAHYYKELLHFPITVAVGHLHFEHSFHFLVNDLLMTVFFFVVGLEVKREVLVGELVTLRRAALPAAGALGGVLLPALIYYVLNQGTPAEPGWGVPMATDIAFVLGALTILGSRVPAPLAIFLVSLAIFDDLVAVVVIAVFYSTDLQLHFLAYGGVILALLAGLNILGFRRQIPYVLLGIVLWVMVYKSGIHPTVAGVFLALTIPCRSVLDTCEFADKAGEVIQQFDTQGYCGYTLHLHERNQSVIRTLEEMCHQMEPPLQRLEHVLHPWVIFGVMPLFALANAGVSLHWDFLRGSLASSGSLGIVLGLFVGKQVGIFTAAWLAVKTRIAHKPAGVTFKHIYGGAILCGIGFTMSLFIAKLSFPDPDLLEGSTIAILAGSLLSGVVGTVVLYLVGRGMGRDRASGMSAANIR